jgi:hypothetical protein
MFITQSQTEIGKQISPVCTHEKEKGTMLVFLDLIYTVFFLCPSTSETMTKKLV